MRILAILGICGLCWLPAPVLAHGCGHHEDCCGHAAWAGDCRGCGWQNPQRQAAETVEGKVVEVDYLPGATAGSGMVEIRVDAGGRTTAVRLGPAGFLSQNGVAVKEGDAVRVRGYRVTTGDGDMLVATEMAKGGKSLALRNSAGRPAW